jgi:hypothetical protein
MVEPTSIPIKTIFLNRGSVVLGASVDNTQVGRGQELFIRLACQNNSAVDILSVRITIQEHIHWSAHDAKRRETITLLATKNIYLPGLSTNKKTKQTCYDSQSDQNTIYEALTSGQNQVRLFLPKHARDTYKGHLVEIRHTAKIELLTPALTSNVETTIPLRIGTPSIGVVSQTTAFSVETPTLPYVPIEREPIERPPYVNPAANPAQMNQHEHIYVPHAEPEVDVAFSDFDEADIPIAEATVLPGPTNLMEETVIRLGGDAILIEEHAPYVYNYPTPTAPPEQDDVSVETLLRAMSRSINDSDLIGARVSDASWQALFRRISRAEFGSIVAHVKSDFDQTLVATTLAPLVNGGNCFTCVYAAAAVKSASEWNRSNMAQRLAPLCVDIEAGHELIRRELNEWERMITGRDFDAAIQAARSR